MSSNDRVERDKALILATGVINWIKSYCDKVEIAGSLRREKETVGDIEIVIQPHNRNGLDITLNRLIEDGTIKKAWYANKGGMVTRWGDRLKCFVIAGVTVEMAIGDADNFGYLYWLRTGPSDGNKFVVTRMMVENAAMRFHDGYGWLCDYVGDTPEYRHKMHLPDEETVFKALGFSNVINPLWRSEKLYKAEWKGVLPRYLLADMLADEFKQKRLF